MTAVEGRRDILTTITDILARLGRLERYATGVPPMTYAFRPADFTALTVATNSAVYVPLAASTFARANRGAQVSVAVRADPGTAGDFVVTGVSGAALPLASSGGLQTPTPITAVGWTGVMSPVVAVDPGPAGGLTEVQVRVRRTSGGGQVYVAPFAVVGVPG